MCAAICMLLPAPGNTWAQDTNIEALIDALKDPDEEVRMFAAYALWRTGPDARDAVPALIDALKDGDGEVRNAAVHALGQIGPDARDAVPALIDALKGDDVFVRIAAADALGQMGRGAVPALIDALKDGDDRVRLEAADALESIALALQDAGAIEMIGPLRSVHAALTDLQEPAVSHHADTVRQAIEKLEPARWKRLGESAVTCIRSYPKISTGIAVYLLLAGLCFILLWLRPLWLLRINTVLRPYLDFRLPGWLGGMKVPVRYVLLVGFFHYRPRVLDAWVAQHMDCARTAFENIHTVQERAIHVATPVVLAGESIPELTAPHLHSTFNKHRGYLLIQGEGGVGKTSLACRLARWAMEETPSARLCEDHPMLPVLIEEDMPVAGTDGQNGFIEAIRGALGGLVDAEGPVPEDLLIKLLRRRRVLVIVDHLSEMTPATREMIQPGRPDFPVNALIVISRVEEHPGVTPKTTVTPLPIRGSSLSSFMEVYLTRREKRDLFDDAEYFRACERLSSMAGDRDTTVLLAKLYAEQMISHKEGPDAGGLPDNLPDLMSAT